MAHDTGSGRGACYHTLLVLHWKQNGYQPCNKLEIPMIVAVWKLHQVWLGSRTVQILLGVGGGAWAWLWFTGDTTTRIVLCAVTTVGLMVMGCLITRTMQLIRTLTPMQIHQLPGAEQHALLSAQTFLRGAEPMASPALRRVWLHGGVLAVLLAHSLRLLSAVWWILVALHGVVLLSLAGVAAWWGTSSPIVWGGVGLLGILWTGGQ
ncbi:hypothetical protein HC928_20590 [bacterium]|nr:hypothetical protein [bacterium]